MAATQFPALMAKPVWCLKEGMQGVGKAAIHLTSKSAKSLLDQWPSTSGTLVATLEYPADYAI